MIIGELNQKRTPNTKTYLNLDGSYETHLFLQDVHFEDDSGNLHNIEVKLFDEADFDSIEDAVSKEKVSDFKIRKEMVKDKKVKNSLNRDLMEFHALKTPFDCIITRNFKRGYSIGKGADKLHFKPVGASPAKGHPCVDKDNAIEYQDPWNDVDVCLELTEIGIKETLIVKTNLAPSTFSFEVTGDLTDELTAGVLKIEPAWLKDAVGTRRDVIQTVRRAGDKVYLDLVADLTGLVYPIEIDPTVTLQPDGTAGIDAQIINGGFANSNYGTGSNLSFGMNGTQISRSLLKFDLSSIPIGATVTSALLTLWSKSAINNLTYYYAVHPITSSWVESTVTWNNQPTFNSSKKDVTTISGQWSADSAKDFNVKAAVAEVVSGAITNNGFIIKDDAELSTDSQKGAYPSDESTYTSYRPKLVVNYSNVPTAPVVTYPNGGETLNANHTITWTPSTDVEEVQSTLKYQIQITTDNGGAWSDIVSLTAAGVTSYAYDFTPIAQTSLAKIRIRAYDGNGYGPWDESNGVFTIQHNQAPLAPTNLSPSSGSQDRAQIIRLSWQHNDPNAPDPQSKFDLQWRLQGAGTWNTVTQTTINQYYDVPANTFPKGNIEWQIRTYDQANVAGPYSAQSTFYAGDKPPNPTITAPTNGSIVAIAKPTIQWSSPDQVKYQLQILNVDNSVASDTNEVVSTNKALSCPINLSNLSSYIVKLRIQNSDGIWSNWVTSNITVSYTSPAIPLVTVTPQNGYINIAIDNPVPSGSEPAVSNNDLYRRELGQTNWIRIKTSIPNDGSYQDYNVASEVTYEYKVQANGNNGTIRESMIAQGSLTLKWLWLHDVTDPQGTVLQVPCNINKSYNPKLEAKVRQFAGREGKTVEFSTAKDVNFKVKLELTLDWRGKLEQLMDRRGTICARDSRGRKIFGFIQGLPEVDQSYGQETDLEIIAIGYSESV